MQISVDISLYPLKVAGYEQPILDFIDALEKEPDVDVVRNELSTQIHGDYALIMQLLQKEIGDVFQKLPHSVFVLKLVGNNRKGILK